MSTGFSINHIKKLQAERLSLALNRKTGYYWVLFNWPMFQPHREPEWQPGSWDSKTKSWAIIGSNQEVPYWQPCVLEVDETLIERKGVNIIGDCRERVERLEAALNYVADMTCINRAAEWEFKRGYDPELVLAALAGVN